jgi:acyl-lipid omega-6 desaturase (Delta-12 desaturase)
VAQRSDLYSLLEPFGRPRRSKAMAELLETFVPYLALNVVMVMAVRRGHPMLGLALSGLAAPFLVRVFIIFHDCCHGSFFPSRRANRIVGTPQGCSP